ncbi:MAG: YciI family protein [Vicinamibacteria bacterium]
MKRLLACASLAVCLGASAAGPTPPVEMTTYTLGLLVKGPKWTADQTPDLQKLQEAHLDHIGEMARSGALLAAGPLLDDGTIRGILIFKVSLDEAKALAEADPAVRAGRLVLELHPWLAPKGVLNESPVAKAGEK